MPKVTILICILKPVKLLLSTKTTKVPEKSISGTFYYHKLNELKLFLQFIELNQATSVISYPIASTAFFRTSSLTSCVSLSLAELDSKST